MNHRILRALAVGTVSVLVFAGLFAAPASAAPRCFGREATIVGGPGNNRIVGTPGPDVIVAGRGNDKVAGRGGDDRICGDGDDDLIFGMTGADRLDGGAGDDTLSALQQSDLAIGGRGEDLVYGGKGGDALLGGSGSDALFGNGGPDDLGGGTQRDFLFGLDGNDRIDGDGGFDLASFVFAGETGITANLATGRANGEGQDLLISISDLTGSRGGDDLIGNGAENFFFPLAGNDVVAGGGGEDLVGFPDANTGITADLTTQTATGEGSDTLEGIEDLAGSNHRDSLTGNDLPNYLFGGNGRDHLFGLGDDDFLDGWEGTDDGDGGANGTDGDTCVRIENPTDCEQQPAVAGRRAAARPVAASAPVWSGGLISPHRRTKGTGTLANSRGVVVSWVTT